MSRERRRQDDTADAGESEDVVFRAVVEEYDDRRDQCTIYPRKASGVDRMSTWITAREGSFVHLEDLR